MAIINPPAWSIEQGTKNALNILLNAFRIAVNGALSVFGMVDGFVDEFEDESGVDTAASTNEAYDSGDDFYRPASVGGGADAFNALLLHCNGVDAATTVLDSSSAGHTITAHGAAQLDTAQKKFGTASLMLAGSGDYLSIPTHASLTLGAGDFTMDGWFRFSNVGKNNIMFYRANDFRLVYIGSLNQLEWTIEGISTAYSATLTTDTWYHIALVRSSGTVTIYLDGVSIGSTANSGDMQGSDPVNIGYSTSDGFNGWADEVRISKGIARWTGNFTPPAAEYDGGTPQDMTLISEGQTAEAEPKTARIVLFEEDIDAVTINTDLKAYVSRDDGTTWTEITLSDEGDYGSGKRILTGQVGITAQPSGTDMRYKLETANSKLLKIHGVALTWD